MTHTISCDNLFLRFDWNQWLGQHFLDKPMRCHVFAAESGESHPCIHPIEAFWMITAMFWHQKMASQLHRNFRKASSWAWALHLFQSSQQRATWLQGLPGYPGRLPVGQNFRGAWGRQDYWMGTSLCYDSNSSRLRSWRSFSQTNSICVAIPVCNDGSYGCKAPYVHPAPPSPEDTVVYNAAIHACARGSWGSWRGIWEGSREFSGSGNP